VVERVEVRFTLVHPSCATPSVVIYTRAGHALVSRVQRPVHTFSRINLPCNWTSCTRLPLTEMIILEDDRRCRSGKWM